MKIKLLFLLVLLNLAFFSFAQTTAIIGTGTASSSAVSGPVDTGTNSILKYSRHISIYRASELNAAGIFSGNLQKISWQKEDSNGYTANDGQFSIYIKPTSKTTHTGANVDWATEVNGATLVYSSTTQNINTATGWQDFVLSTPFNWNGTDNLMILVNWYRPSAITAPVKWRFTVTTDANAIGPGSTAPPTIYRNNSRPNIKLEFGTSTVSDAGITSITAPLSPVQPGVSQPVQVIMRNFGGNSITSATINWSVDGVLQTPYVWTGNLAPAQITAPVVIGQYSFPAGSHSLCAWSSLSSGPDFNPHNDSTCTTLASCAPLNGNYTINSGAAASATNFTSFSAVAQRLNDCGISGYAKFTVAPGSGPYNGQIVLRNLAGNPDSVVFEGNGATLTGITTNANPALILLDGAKNVTFRNLTFTPATGFTRFYGIQLLNGADQCTVAKCNIS